MTLAPAIDLATDADAIAVATGFLKRLGHPSRLAIVARLAEGEMSVAQMEAGLGLEQPSLSQQLAALRTAGIITARREAKTVFYCLSDEKARHMVELLRRLFAGAADEASSAIEAPEIPRASPNPRKMSLGAAVFARVGSKAEPEQASSDTGNPSGPTSLGRAS